jgi:hypothetical protein
MLAHFGVGSAHGIPAPAQRDRAGAMMVPLTQESQVLQRFMLALALVLASGTALSTMTECQADCETQYKACSTNRKMSESGCRAQYEKCRQACAKKAGSPSPT